MTPSLLTASFYAGDLVAPLSARRTATAVVANALGAPPRFFRRPRGGRFRRIGTLCRLGQVGARRRSLTPAIGWWSLGKGRFPQTRHRLVRWPSTLCHQIIEGSCSRTHGSFHGSPPSARASRPLGCSEPTRKTSRHKPFAETPIGDIRPTHVSPAAGGGTRPPRRGEVREPPMLEHASLQGGLGWSGVLAALLALQLVLSLHVVLLLLFSFGAPCCQCVRRTTSSRFCFARGVAGGRRHGKRVRPPGALAEHAADHPQRFGRLRKLRGRWGGAAAGWHGARSA